MNKILNMIPIDPLRLIDSESLKKYQLGHEHFVTIEIDLADKLQQQGIELLNLYNEVKNTTLNNAKEIFSLFPEFQYTESTAVDQDNSKTSDTNFSLNIKDHKGHDLNLWQDIKNNKEHPFALEDFYDRVPNILVPQKNNQKLKVLALSKEALTLLNGGGYKLDSEQSFVTPSVNTIFPENISTGASIPLKGIDNVSLCVDFKNVYLITFDSGTLFISFQLQYRLHVKNLINNIPNYKQLSEAIKFVSTATNRNNRLNYNLISSEHDTSFVDSTKLKIDELRDKLTIISKQKKMIELSEKQLQVLQIQEARLVKKIKEQKSLCTYLIKKNGSKEIGVNLREIVTHLLGTNICGDLSKKETVRSHSYFCANIDQNMSTEEIDYLGFLFAKKYTQDYIPPHLDFISIKKAQPLRNKQHYCSQEGGALLVSLPDNKKALLNTPEFDRVFISARGAKTYFPLSLISLHEFHLLVKALQVNFSNFDDTKQIASLYDKSLGIRLKYRTQIASQLSQHNEVHDCWRSSYRLDELYGVLSEDLRELFEKNENKLHKESLNHQEVFSLEQSQRELQQDFKGMNNLYRVESIGITISALLLFASIYGMNFDFFWNFKDTTIESRQQFTSNTFIILVIGIVMSILYKRNIYKKSKLKNKEKQILNEMELRRKGTKHNGS